jgi:hypothetical protein
MLSSLFVPVFVHFFDVFMVMNVSAVLHVVSIVVSHMFGYMLVMMNVAAVGMMVSLMVFHVVCNVLMVVFYVSAVLHTVNMVVFFGMWVLNMVQFSLTVVFCTATMERMAVMCDVIVVFHDFSLLFMGSSAMFHTQRLTCAHFWL